MYISKYMYIILYFMLLTVFVVLFIFYLIISIDLEQRACEINFPRDEYVFHH